MLKIICAFAISAIATTASAGCFGPPGYQTCNDASGNKYTVQRFGNTTIMNGNNARTGAQWNQQSQTFGNTTIHNGVDSDGNAWSTTCFNGRCN